MKDAQARLTAETNNILIHSVERRMRELERTVDMLLRHLNLEIRHRTGEYIAPAKALPGEDE